MKKWLLTLCMVLALACCDNKKESEKADNRPVVKIGAILPMSGDMAVWGNSEKNGLLLAYEKISANAKNRYELIIEDSSNANKNIQHIAQKLLSLDKVDAIITMLDPAANIVGPMASENKVIHFGQSWFPKYVGDKYNYNVYADMREEARLIVKYLEEKNIKRVYFFTVNQTGFIGGTNILKDMLTEKEIAYKETFFNFGQRDFRTDVLKTKNFEPEVYVIGAFAPEADILAQQLKQIVGNNVIITGLDLGLNIGNKAVYEGSVFASPSLPNENFIRDYIEKVHDENFMFGAVVGFISFNAIIYAFENEDKRENVAEFLHNSEAVPTIFDKKINKDKGMIFMPSDLLTIRDKKILSFEE